MKKFLLPGLLFGFTLIAYFPVLRAGYIWDDSDYVTENPTLRSLQGLSQNWREPGSSHTQYYPLTRTVFWAAYQLWGPDPRGYHLLNLLLHISNALLLAWVLRMLRVPGAWAAAFIFALHPVHVESAAWVSELKNLLALCFYLLSIASYWRFIELRPEKETRYPARAWRWYGGALLCFVLALLSKTIACSMPAVILLLAWWRKGRLRWRDVRDLIPFFALGAAAAWVTIWVEKNFVGAAGAAWDLSMLERCLIAGRVVWFYAGKLIWPYPLMFIYPRWDPHTFGMAAYLFPLLVILVLGVLWVERRRLSRGPLTAVLFFLGTLAPAMGFINVYPMKYSWVADHFQYVSSIGLIALFAAGITAAFKRPRAALLFFVPVCALLAWRTRTELGKYHDATSLWQDTLAKNPAAAIAHNHLGQALFEKGENAEALVHFRRAVELNPENPDYHFTYATLLTRLRQYAEAVAHYEVAIRLNPSDDRYYNNLGIAFAQQGRKSQAIHQFNQALQRNPGNAGARRNLSRAKEMRT